jgi:hypothetical protein
MQKGTLIPTSFSVIPNASEKSSAWMFRFAQHDSVKSMDAFRDYSCEKSVNHPSFLATQQFI